MMNNESKYFSKNIWKDIGNEYNIKDMYYKELLTNREQGKYRLKYTDEQEFISLIAAGEIEKIRKSQFYANLDIEKNLGRVSKNYLRNHKYIVIIYVALVVRGGIKGGLDENEAFTLSDVYIQKADNCNSVDSLYELYYDMVMEVTNRVRRKRTTKLTVSKPIKVAIEYISENLHDNIGLKEVCNEVELSQSYFSNLFKKETGYTITEFIRKRKMEEAQYLLKFSEYDLFEISHMLGFASQSYFATVFKKYLNMTPNEYRKLFA